MTHWKKLAHNDYIGAYALTPGEDLTVTIKSVARQNVTGSGGRVQDCIVATLEGNKHKPLILNSTNAKTIAKLYGPMIEDWAGKQITLYASTTQLAGEQVECLRIRPAVPGPVAKPAIAEDRFAKALDSIKAGTFTAAKLAERYELTAEQTAQLAQLGEGE